MNIPLTVVQAMVFHGLSSPLGASSGRMGHDSSPPCERQCAGCYPAPQMRHLRKPMAFFGGIPFRQCTFPGSWSACVRLPMRWLLMKAAPLSCLLVNDFHIIYDTFVACCDKLYEGESDVRAAADAMPAVAVARQCCDSQARPCARPACSCPNNCARQIRFELGACLKLL